MIQQSVEKLGFRFSAIKILLISHAHFDHDAGTAGIKKLTGLYALRGYCYTPISTQVPGRARCLANLSRAGLRERERTREGGTQQAIRNILRSD